MLPKANAAVGGHFGVGTKLVTTWPSLLDCSFTGVLPRIALCWPVLSVRLKTALAAGSSMQGKASRVVALKLGGNEFLLLAFGVFKEAG